MVDAVVGWLAIGDWQSSTWNTDPRGRIIIPSMPRQTPFDIAIGTGHVPGMLRTPGDADDAPPAPAVLICGGLPGGAHDHSAFVEALSERLLARDIAVVRLEARVDDDASRSDAASVVDDAAAVFRWLLAHDAVDPHAVGVLGVGLGAIVAAGLAARTNQVRRLCLVAPATNDDAVARLAKTNGVAPLLAPDTAEAGNGAWVASLASLVPTRDVAVHDRPTLVVHGAADRVVESVRPWVDAVDGAGHHVAHERIARADHLFTAPDLRDVCLDRIVSFLDPLRVPVGSGKKE